jgi:hypothetical protein
MASTVGGTNGPRRIRLADSKPEPPSGGSLSGSGSLRDVPLREHRLGCVTHHHYGHINPSVLSESKTGTPQAIDSRGMGVLRVDDPIVVRWHENRSNQQAEA